MKRKLTTQIKNEWRSNIWLALELTIVSVVIWWIADAVYVRLWVYNQPLGFDYEHVYELNFEELNEQAEGFIPGRTDEEKINDRFQLIERIAARPEIEAVGLGLNSVLYNGSNTGAALVIDSLNTYNGDYVLQRLVTPDFLRVYRFTGSHGETPDELAQKLKENPNLFFATNNIFSGYGITDLSPYIGRTFENKGNGSSELTLGGTINTIRYSDFQDDSPSVIQHIHPVMFTWARELVVRVKENMDKDFEENFMKDTDTQLRVGNLAISSVTSVTDKRKDFNSSNVSELRGFIIGTVFLAFNVFLGLLGTFWFRTQQREHEIAIRRVNGATTRQVFLRTISEGLLILTLITPAALLIEYALTQYELNTQLRHIFLDPTRFWICAAISYALIGLMIILGALPPAIRAVKVNPATALSEE